MQRTGTPFPPAQAARLRTRLVLLPPTSYLLFCGVTQNPRYHRLVNSVGSQTAQRVSEGPLHQIALQQLGLRQPAPVALRIDGLGGLEGGVSMVSASVLTDEGRRHSGSFVLKALDPEHREAAVYRWLAASGLSDLAPRMLGATVLDGRPQLVLERVRPATRWPWRQMDHAGAVVDALARLHASGDVDTFVRDVPAWRYGEEIAAGAAGTLAVLHGAGREGYVDPREVRPAVKVAERLDDIGREIAASFVPAVLHGDAHPGNAMMAASHGTRVPKLVDWQRARVGSPLEDLCSWLQSLACWEPAVRQRHDTLLRRYYRARGHTAGPGRDLRDAYWLAGARNAFAGALRYHLVILLDPAAPARARTRSQQAARDWLRIIRRASLALR